MTFDLRAFAIQTARETFQPPTRPSRPCEQCDRTAWYVMTDPDGCRSYQCSHGHLLIVAPIVLHRHEGSSEC